MWPSASFCKRSGGKCGPQRRHLRQQSSAGVGLPTYFVDILRNQKTSAGASKAGGRGSRLLLWMLLSCLSETNHLLQAPVSPLEERNSPLEQERAVQLDKRVHIGCTTPRYFFFGGDDAAEKNPDC
jgi:hypothetical protein